MNDRVERFMHSVTWWSLRWYRRSGLVALVKGLLYIAVILALNFVAYLILFVYIPLLVLWLLGG